MADIEISLIDNITVVLSEELLDDMVDLYGPERAAIETTKTVEKEVREKLALVEHR